VIPLSAETLATYVNHAFAAMNRVLDRVDDDTVNVTPDPWGTNSIAGLVTHCCELAPSWFATPGLGRETTRDRDAEFDRGGVARTGGSVTHRNARTGS
jgi:hypothetical protein